MGLTQILDPSRVRAAVAATQNNPDLRILMNSSGVVIDGHHRLLYAIQRGLPLNIQIQGASTIPQHLLKSFTDFRRAKCVHFSKEVF